MNVLLIVLFQYSDTHYKTPHSMTQLKISQEEVEEEIIEVEKEIVTDVKKIFSFGR